MDRSFRILTALVRTCVCVRERERERERDLFNDAADSSGCRQGVATTRVVLVSCEGGGGFVHMSEGRCKILTDERI